VGVHDDDPTFGWLRMVVMGYVNGETLHEVKHVLPSAKEEVACALEINMIRTMLFGDPRQQNVNNYKE
jgi:hypothetical protein